MDDIAGRRSQSCRQPLSRRRSWCCSFSVSPTSPEHLRVSQPKPLQKLETLSKSANSFPNSPQSARSGLGLVGRIDPRRILSPGRVSPIDSDPTGDLVNEILTEPSPVGDSGVRSASFRASVDKLRTPPEGSASPGLSNVVKENGNGTGVFDVRLNLKGKTGGSLVLELNSEVLRANSSVFADLISDYEKGSSGSASKFCRIEVPEVEHLGAFRETIELMFEEDITKRLLKAGVYRAIDILEVSAGIMFTKGVLSCLKYLEAVPWSEEEEEKLRSLFTRFKFDDATTKDILARLYSLDLGDLQGNFARQLVWSITACVDNNARNELKSLVKGLLCKSSVYEKDNSDLNKEDLYAVCQSCLGSLVALFEEATNTGNKVAEKDMGNNKPLIERISREVDNINWLLDILLDRQMGEEFVEMWAKQGELVRMHEKTSPMVRYELSRVSAMLFLAMGSRKMHCRWEARLGVVEAWFGAMLVDFGWLQRCKKGMDMKALEDRMGQALLTLPLKHQNRLFMEWFRSFSKHGNECPNLSKAFQIWWRRSFLRGSETRAIESR